MNKRASTKDYRVDQNFLLLHCQAGPFTGTPKVVQQPIGTEIPLALARKTDDLNYGHEQTDEPGPAIPQKSLRP